jgi:hypothetical protein
MQTTAPTSVPAPTPPAVKPQASQMNGESMPPPTVAIDEKKESPSADGYLHDPQMHPVAAVAMNGGMPPQQVYVNTAMGHHHGMAALEQHFQSFGMNGVHDMGHHDHDCEDDDNDGEDTEDDPVKLFVGQVRGPFVCRAWSVKLDACSGRVLCHFFGQSTAML